MSYPLVRAWTSLQARWVDARFVHRQGLRPTVGNRILAYPSLAWQRSTTRLGRRRQDALFERYSGLHEQHYGPGGRGYEDVAPAGHDERSARYSAQVSRLEYFIDRFDDLLGYRDGDSFLDLGCGTGQNLRALARRYPRSSLFGLDLNADALGLIEECEPHERLSLRVADLTDEAAIEAFVPAGVDHVVVSHVFALVMAPSTEETVELRKRIVAFLAGLARKSVVIVDHFGAGHAIRISIEQSQRAVVEDDVLRYFTDLPNGRAVLADSPRSQAIIFQRG